MRPLHRREGPISVATSRSVGRWAHRHRGPDGGGGVWGEARGLRKLFVKQLLREHGLTPSQLEDSMRDNEEASCRPGPRHVEGASDHSGATSPRSLFVGWLLSGSPPSLQGVLTGLAPPGARKAAPLLT